MDNIYPDQSNDKFDIQYARRLGLSSDIRASFGSGEDGSSPVIKTPDDNSTGHLRFGVAAEDAVAIQNRSFDLNGAYSFQLTQLGNKQFLVDPPNGLYQLGAIPVPGSDSGLSYTYIEIDDTTNKITLQAPEGIVLPGYGYGNHAGTYTKFLAVDAGGNMIEVDAAGGGSVTADNGLTMSTSTNVQLGGTLLQNTTIDTAANTLNITTSTGGVSPFTATATTGVAGIFTSGNLPLWIVNDSAAAANIGEGININRNGVGVVGMGTRILSNLPNSSSSTINASSIITGWTNATPGTENSYFELDLNNGSGLVPKLIIFSAGNILATGYGAGTFTGTDAYWLAVDSSGNIIEMAAPTGGGSITADNGLTMSTSTNVQLGGTLLQTTGINTTSSYKLNFTGDNSTGFDAPFTFTNSNGSNGFGITVTGFYGIYTNATAGYGIYSSGGTGGYFIGGNGLIAVATNTNGTCVFADVSNGTALLGQTGAGLSGDFVRGNATTTGIEEVVTIRRGVNSAPAVGFGEMLSFQMVTSNTASYLYSNKIISKWTDPAEATATSSLVLQGLLSASVVDLLTLAADGSVMLRPITATEASAITPVDGMIVKVNSTNGTFTAVGFWGYDGTNWTQF